MPLGHLFEGVAVGGPGRRPERLDEQLARLERRREVRDEEFFRRDGAAGARDNRAAEDRQRERKLRRSVGVRDRAADGSTVARDEMADVRQAVGEEWDLEQSPVRLADERPHAPRAVLARDLAERQPVHVHDHGRAGEPHVEHRHEALPACEHFRLAPMLGEHRDRLLDRLGPLVEERDRFHRVT